MEEELGLSLGDLIKALKRRWLLILIIPVIAAVAAHIYVANYTVDMYTAQVRLYTLFDYVDNTGTTRYDLSSSAYFVRDYAQMFQTNEVVTETCNRLGWPSFPAGTSFSVGAVPDTRFITINVTSLYPEVSMQAANMLATVFTEYVHSLFQTNSVRIASAATLPTWPSNSGRGSYIPMAFAAALGLVIAAIIGLEMINTKVRSDRDADIKFQVNVLSQIVEYKKEMDAFLRRHMSHEKNLLQCMNEHTQESIRKLLVNLEFASMGQEMRTLTVTSTTPKEGKSSIALMLACEMASQGKRVLIADMDYRSPMIGRYLGRRNKKDILDYMNGSARLNEVISRTNTENLYFMDSRHRIAANTKLESFAQFLAQCREHFDLVIFDTAPLGMFIDAASLAAKSDATLVIVADGRVEGKELRKILAQLEKVKANVLGIAFNFVSRKEKNYYYNRYYRHGSHHSNERRLMDSEA